MSEKLKTMLKYSMALSIFFSFLRSLISVVTELIFNRICIPWMNASYFLVSQGEKYFLHQFTKIIAIWYQYYVFISSYMYDILERSNILTIGCLCSSFAVFSLSVLVPMKGQFFNRFFFLQSPGYFFQSLIIGIPLKIYPKCCFSFDLFWKKNAERNLS